MAEHMPAGPIETGAEMDYAEHEKTYALFIALSKWGALLVASLLVAMAFGFFTSAGVISSAILFVLILVLGAFVLR